MAIATDDFDGFSSHCKTPEQTLYGSIFSEINAKEQPRIVKSDIKGKFRNTE